MKKIMSILMLWAMCLPLLAQGGTSENEPGSGGDGSETKTYTLSLNCVPALSASLSGSAQLVAGQEQYIYAAGRTGFRFVCWKEGDQVVSDSYWFYYTMPERDVTLTAYFEYDPRNPEDPVMPTYETTYKLNTIVTPAFAASTNIEKDKRVAAGKEEYIYASGRTGFKFVCWKEGEQVVSDNYWFYYTMPDHDVTLTAVFKYDPDNLDNPNGNHYYADTKTAVVDNFRPGNFYSAYYSLYSNLNEGDIAKLVVSGQLNASDVSNTSNMKPAVVDLSRTSGYSYLNSMGSNDNLTTLILPECINEIYYYAFSSTPNLSSLTIYAYTPPKVDRYMLEYLKPENVTVFVPGASIGLYADDPIWGQFNIMPITADVVKVTVAFPQDVNPADYEDCYVQLVNAKNGQVVNYVVSANRDSYVFNNIIKNTVWDAALVKDGQLMSDYTHFEVAESDVSVSLSNLLTFQNVTARVQTPEGEDVTESTDVTWLNVNGNYLGAGPTLPKQLKGASVVARISLPNDMLMAYQPLNEQSHIVGEGDDSNIVTFNLQHRVQGKLNLTVADENNASIEGARLVLTQQVVKGMNDYSITATTSADGKAEMSYYEGADMSMTIMADGFINAVVNISSSQMGDGNFNIILSKVANGEIQLTGKGVYAHDAGQEATAFDATEPMFDYFYYSLRNKTQDKEITQFGRTGSKIQLLESVADGDVVEVTASLRSQDFPIDPATSEGIISGGNATVDLVLVQRGCLWSELQTTEADEFIALLFDAEGTLVKSTKYDDSKKVYIPNLPSGNYQLVTMPKQDRLSTAGSLQALSELGLKENSDYTLTQLAIQTGINTHVKPEYTKPVVVEVPKVFLSPSSSFTVNKAEVTLGNYLTLNTQIYIMPEWSDKIKGAELIVDLTEHNEMVANSIIVGGQTAAYTYNKNKVGIFLTRDDLSKRIRFCCTPTKTGTYTPTAYLKLTITEDGQDKEYTTPIGSASFKAKSFDFSVPKVTATADITVRGMAPANSRIIVYNGDVPIARTTALADGSWSVRVNSQEQYEEWCKIYEGSLTQKPTYTEWIKIYGAEMKEGTNYIWFEAIVTVAGTSGSTNSNYNTTGSGGRLSVTYTTDANGNITYNATETAEDENTRVLQSDMKEVLYDPDAVLPSTASFQFYNKWLRQTVSVSYDLLNCHVSTTSYMFYIPAEFTFTTEFTVDDPSKFKQVIINVWMEDGSVVPLEAAYSETLHKYVATRTFEWGNLPANLSVDWVPSTGELMVLDASYVGITPCTAWARAIHDPSGYVYEAVGSNRLEGVTASVYYKETYEDMYGDPQERVVLWDAENYAQENPLFTDANGIYRWDVPQGLWQVKFEKPGFETTYSEWLPVPPPQLEVNVGMTQQVNPRVAKANAYDDMVEVEFSLYMKPSSLNAENIVVTLDGQKVAGSIELLNEEAVSADDATTYATRLRFVPADPTALVGKSQLSLIVSQQVEAYNGKFLEQTYQQDLSIEARAKELIADAATELKTGEEKQLTISVQPAAVAAGKTVLVTVASNDIVTTEVTALTLNDKGEARLDIKGVLPGETVISYELADTRLEAQTSVKVVLDDATGIEEIEASGRTSSAEHYYNLKGQRVTTPSKGIYILGNKKMVVK